MKKGMIILIILIIVFSILCILKEKNKSIEKENNPYSVFTFYKKENLERYKKYHKNQKSIRLWYDYIVISRR